MALMAGRLGGRGVIAMVAVVLASAIARGDERTERLVELLQNSGNYRVRVQSAQSLGRIRDPLTVSSLVHALLDEHPAVRAAAAQALGRIGSPQALAPLRRIAQDRSQTPEVTSQVEQAIIQIQRMSSMESAPPPSAGSSSTKALFYIGVGEMGNTTGKRAGELEETLARIVREELATSGGIKLAPPSETPSQTARVLSGTSLKGYFVQGSVTRLEEVGGEITAVVSIMVLSNPGRDLRMMLQGRGIASVKGSGRLGVEQQRGLEDSALTGAVKGALSRLAQQLGVGN